MTTAEYVKAGGIINVIPLKSQEEILAEIKATYSERKYVATISDWGDDYAEGYYEAAY